MVMKSGGRLWRGWRHQCLVIDDIVESGDLHIINSFWLMLQLLFAN